MTTHLKITTVYEDGRTEMHDQDWPGWDLESAASVMRARRRAAGGGLLYDVPLTQRQLEFGVVRQIHEWTDTDAAALPDAGERTGGGSSSFSVVPRSAA